jgi:phosphoglycerol transferase MdoB-like AlkP superfamily enzyme
MKSCFSNLEREVKLMLLFLIGSTITHPIVHIIIGYCVHQFVDISDLIDFPNALYIELASMAISFICSILCLVLIFITTKNLYLKIAVATLSIPNIILCVLANYVCYMEFFNDSFNSWG